MLLGPVKIVLTATRDLLKRQPSLDHSVRNWSLFNNSRGERHGFGCIGQEDFDTSRGVGDRFPPIQYSSIIYK